MLKHLASKHDVHLLTFAGSDAQVTTESLEQLCAAVHLVAPYERPTSTRIRDMLSSNTPDLALRLASQTMTRTLAELLQNHDFDILQIEGLEMAVHWERIRVSSALDSRRRPLVLFDDHNCEYLLQKRAFEIDRMNPAKWHAAVYSLVQWRRLARFEAQVAAAADGVVVVSEEDAEALRAIASPRLMAVIQNGIDVASFARKDDRPRLTSGGPHLVFTGTMDYRPNVDAATWFCKHVFSSVRSAVPDAKLWIVGVNPREEVKRLSKLDGVVVTGFVEDVRQFLDRATVYVVPMRFGGGVRFKVLEAMASGLPIVSTSMGYQGIRATDGVDVLIGDSPKDFARAVVSLLSSPDLRRSLGSNALNLVTRNYDWKVILPKIDVCYEELQNRRGDAGSRVTGGEGDV